MNEDRWFAGTVAEKEDGLVIHASATRAVQETDYPLTKLLRAAKTDQGEIRFQLQDGALAIAQRSAAAKIASDRTLLELCRKLATHDRSLMGQFLWLRNRISKKVFRGKITRINYGIIYFTASGNEPIADLNDLLSNDYDIVLAKDKGDADDIINLLYS